MARIDENNLKCEVCYEIIHNPVNCSPCCHKFCASCLYRWLDLHDTCPKCRYVLKEVTRDVFANYICEQFVASNPEHKKKDELIRELDEIELEYIEKLLLRSRSRYNNRVTTIMDEEDEERAIRYERSLKKSNIAKRLFLGSHRQYREKEWMDRSKKLRENLNLPPRDFTEPELAPRQRKARRRILIEGELEMAVLVSSDSDETVVRENSDEELDDADHIDYIDPQDVEEYLGNELFYSEMRDLEDQIDDISYHLGDISNLLFGELYSQRRPAINNQEQSIDNTTTNTAANSRRTSSRLHQRSQSVPNFKNGKNSGTARRRSHSFSSQDNDRIDI